MIVYTNTSSLLVNSGGLPIKFIQRLKNVCPFTKQPLTRRQLVKLTQDNFEEYKDKIVNWDIRTDAAAESGEASGEASGSAIIA